MACSVSPASGLREKAATARPDVETLMGNSRAAVLGTLVSRITGFGRMAVAASVLGPTYFGNLFQTIAILPSAMYLVLIGKLISAVLVPPLVRRMSDGGRAEVERFAGAVLGLMLVVMLGVSLVGALTAPLLLRVLTVAVTDPHIRQEQLRLGFPLLLMLIPQTALYATAGVAAAVQQAQGRFALPAFAPASENLLNIGVLGTSALLFGIGLDVAQVTPQQVLLLGLGSTAAASVHAALQWIGAYRVGVRLRPRLCWPDAEVQQIIKRGAVSIGYVAADYIAYLLLLVIAGTVPGGVVALQITNSFCMLPVALAATPLANAQLPLLATRHQLQDMHGFGATYQSALRLVIFMTVPAAVILAGMPYALASAAAFGAMNTQGGIALIAACLGGQGVGVIGDAVFILSTTASYARHDTTAPLSAVIARLMIIIICAATVRALINDATMTMWTLGLSVAIANLAAGGLVYRRLRSALPMATHHKVGLISALVSSAIALVPAVLLNQQFHNGARLASYQRVWFALGVTAVSVSVYLMIRHLSGSRELRLLFSLAGRRAVSP